MIGCIGGSGLYDLDGLENIERRALETPFGAPSDEYVLGQLKGHAICFLPRHGRGHRVLPSEINHRANIYGFKLLGVDQIISVSAVGSLREDLRPRDVVLPDQYFDRTKQSESHTFFGGGIAAHVPFGEPGCATMRPLLARSVQAAAARLGRDVRVQARGTYVCMEGPAFSTKAESQVHRALGFDVVGMTSLAEAKLCKEAEICYQAMAMVTDYDCWHETEEAVTVQMVIGHVTANTELAKAALLDVIPHLPSKQTCACGRALEHAVMTHREAMPAAAVARLGVILQRHL
ncbi:MAG: S-methyl-5'-thioadenosine phosphorylase [Lentisphaerae bacterium]|nr:S-methyl-5'-thioadenosine phosphorylase [Lentisphaerota bacterium]